MNRIHERCRESTAARSALSVCSTVLSSCVIGHRNHRLCAGLAQLAPARSHRGPVWIRGCPSDQCPRRGSEPTLRGSPRLEAGRGRDSRGRRPVRTRLLMTAEGEEDLGLSPGLQVLRKKCGRPEPRTSSFKGSDRQRIVYHREPPEQNTALTHYLRAMARTPSHSSERESRPGRSSGTGIPLPEAGKLPK